MAKNVKRLDIYEVYKAIRKPVPSPTQIHNDHKKKERRDSKDFIRKDKWKYE